MKSWLMGKSTTDEERVLARGLKRDKIVKIAWLSGYKNFVGKRDREKFIFNAFVESRLSVGLTG